MARGWESKSVEEQIESAKARKGDPSMRLTPDEEAALKKRSSLELQRTRVLHDLEKCTDQRYRGILAAGLAYLDEQLAKLDLPAPR